MPYPCFWYAREASAAFRLYAEALAGAEVSVDNGFFCELTLGDSRMAGINGGPRYRPSDAVSVFAELPDAAAVDAAYAALTGGGAEVKMPLGAYDWSERYAWLTDAWGVSWQLVCVPGAAPALSPAVMFFGDYAGVGHAALAHYGEVFAGSTVAVRMDFPAESPTNPGQLMHAQLATPGGKVILCDSAPDRDVPLTEGGSLLVYCDTQAEIDHYWAALTRDGGVPGRRGWLTDRFGVSWQVVPRRLAAWMSNPATAQHTATALQDMTRPILAELEPPRRSAKPTGLEILRDL